MADHKDEAERRTVARAAQSKLHLGQITFTTDAMSNATAEAYHAFPNAAAVLIGKDGAGAGVSAVVRCVHDATGDSRSDCP